MCKSPVQQIEEFETNQRWFLNHFEELLREHADEFVAIWHNSVLGANKDIILLREMVQKKARRASGVYVEYVTDKPLELVL